MAGYYDDNFRIIPVRLLNLAIRALHQLRYEDAAPLIAKLHDLDVPYFNGADDEPSSPLDAPIEGAAEPAPEPEPPPASARWARLREDEELERLRGSLESNDQPHPL